MQPPNSLKSGKSAMLLPWFQGLYYFISGVWPLLSMSSFQLVTGPKTDLWLVNTVGLLLMVTGSVLILAAYRRRIPLEIVVLAIGNASVLIAISCIYWLKGIISIIYLLDAGVEVLLIIGWLFAWQRMKKVAPDRPL